MDAKCYVKMSKDTYSVQIIISGTGLDYHNLDQTPIERILNQAKAEFLSGTKSPADYSEVTEIAGLINHGLLRTENFQARIFYVFQPIDQDLIVEFFISHIDRDRPVQFRTPVWIWETSIKDFCKQDRPTPDDAQRVRSWITKNGKKLKHTHGIYAICEYMEPNAIFYIKACFAYYCADRINAFFKAAEHLAEEYHIPPDYRQNFHYQHYRLTSSLQPIHPETTDPEAVLTPETALDPKTLPRYPDSAKLSPNFHVKLPRPSLPVPGWSFE